MNTIIIYKSKTGFTKKYAQWLQEEIGCAILDFDNIAQVSLSDYDLIVYGSRLYAGKIDGLKHIQTLISDNPTQQLAVFATGATPAAAEDEINSVWQTNFSPEELKKTPHFYLPGGINYDKMGFGSKLMLKTLAKLLKKKSDKTPAESDFAQALSQSFDNSAEEYLIPLLDYIKSF